MSLSTNGERACLVKTTVLLLQNLYFSLIHTEQYNSSSSKHNKLHSYLSNGNFCSIRLEQFWLSITSNSWIDFLNAVASIRRKWGQA